MKSPTRQEVQRFMKEAAANLDLTGRAVLDIGTAGNPTEGENREWFGKDAAMYTTLDKLESTNPDIVADITDAKEICQDSFDVVILSQTLEHILHPRKAIAECGRILKLGGTLIVDSPWMGTDYHPEDGFDDYYRYSAACLREMCLEHDFDIVDEKQTQLLSFVVARKK